MEIIRHNLKPEDMRSFTITSTEYSGSYDPPAYMHSVESTDEEKDEAERNFTNPDETGRDSFDEWLDFVAGSPDYIHFADEAEEVEFVVLPKDEIIMYLWLDGRNSKKIERVLNDLVNGKMVEVAPRKGWFEGAVRNFPPFNDNEGKDYICMNGKYYTYPEEKRKTYGESFRRRGRMLREGKEYKLIIMPHITADVWDVAEDDVVDGSEYTDYLEPRVFVTEDGLCNYVALWAWEDNGLDGKVTEMAKNPKTKDCVAIEDDDDFYDEDEENLGGKIIVVGSNSADKIDLAPLDSCKYKWTISVGYEWETVSKEDYETYKDQALDI